MLQLINLRPRCRSCTSVKDWMQLAKADSSKQSSTTAATAGAASITAAALSSLSPTYPLDCPADVETLGNHTWTLLHSITATYPTRASAQQQSDMKQFLTLFGKLYPCWQCAEDFQEWMGRTRNEPRVEGRSELGRWMCEAHNEVNRKLGKKVFDCGRWEERWRDGWRDGRCG